MAGQVCEYVDFVTGPEKCHTSIDGDTCYAPTKVEEHCVEAGDKADPAWFQKASERLNADILKYAADNDYRIYARGLKGNPMPPALLAIMGGAGTAVAGTMTGLGGMAIGTGTIVGGVIATASGAVVIAGLGAGAYGVGLAAYEAATD